MNFKSKSKITPVNNFVFYVFRYNKINNIVFDLGRGMQNINNNGLIPANGLIKVSMTVAMADGGMPVDSTMWFLVACSYFANLNYQSETWLAGQAFTLVAGANQVCEHSFIQIYILETIFVVISFTSILFLSFFFCINAVLHSQCTQ